MISKMFERSFTVVQKRPFTTTAFKGAINSIFYFFIKKGFLAEINTMVSFIVFLTCRLNGVSYHDIKVSLLILMLG